MRDINKVCGAAFAIRLVCVRMSCNTQVDVHNVVKYRLHDVIHDATANLSLMSVGAALRFNSEFQASASEQ
eukprot:7595-Heterococcus_DN1.PRE.2